MDNEHHLLIDSDDLPIIELSLGERLLAGLLISLLIASLVGFVSLIAGLVW